METLQHYPLVLRVIDGKLSKSSVNPCLVCGGHYTQSFMCISFLHFIYTKTLFSMYYYYFHCFMEKQIRKGENLGPSDSPELEIITTLGFFVSRESAIILQAFLLFKSQSNNNGQNGKSVQFLFLFSILMSFIAFNNFTALHRSS